MESQKSKKANTTNLDRVITLNMSKAVTLEISILEQLVNQGFNL